MSLDAQPIKTLCPHCHLDLSRVGLTNLVHTFGDVDGKLAEQPWHRLCLVEHDTARLTGDCEQDCQDACAYPGQFSECSTS